MIKKILCCLTIILPAQLALADDAGSLFTQGMAAMEQGQLVQARSALSDALFSRELDKQQESQAVKVLTMLAQDTVFSANIIEGDPLVIAYTMRAGDTIASVNRKLGCNVPSDFLEKINGVDASQIKQGTTLKFIRGPFCGLISKQNFTLDIYLSNGGQKIFVRRAKVAIGKNDGTPVGMFRVSGKAQKATWVPPKSMAKKYKKPVKWGQKGYPLGKEGLFMSLRGIDDSTRSVKGYGIHGTNAQWSIGKAASHGCIRVGDKDISAIWSLMTEGASRVEITD